VCHICATAGLHINQLIDALTDGAHNRLIGQLSLLKHTAGGA